MIDVLNILGLNKESMNLTENRLKTLVYWPIEFISVEKLAESGFYYDGLSRKKDTVYCFSCKISLSDWKPEYIPNEQHKKYAKFCEHLSKISEDPMHPEYKSIEARKESFNEMKYHQNFSAESLYTSGFFYVEKDDMCCCYRCGKRIIRWTESSDPLEVHKRFNPNCKLFEEFETQLDSKKSILDMDLECATGWSQPFDVCKDFSNVNVEESNICCVCYEKPKNLALNPCGHVFCSDCVSNCIFCPTCRENIKSTLRVYL